MKMDLQEIAWKDLDWIYLVQDRNRWWAVLNIVMNFGFHKVVGISWLTVKLLASEDKVHFVELGFRLVGWVGLGWLI
jgi:hypothetical protein